MKCHFFTVPMLLLLTSGLTVKSQPASSFINNGSITSPLTIDATNFINNGFFDIAFNQFNANSAATLLLTTALAPFDFSDVQNYTNRGFMASDTGFIFDNAPSTSGSRHASGVFGNANLGQITSGSITNMFFDGFVFYLGPTGNGSIGTPVLTVAATNIVNTGLLDVGVNGLIGLGGQNLNLARGTLHVEDLHDLTGLSSGSSVISIGSSEGYLDFGVFDQYWGLGKQTNLLGAGNLGLPGSLFAASPGEKVTYFPATPSEAEVSPPDPAGFAFTTQIDVSNFLFQAVIVNTNILAKGISVAVGFEDSFLGPGEVPVVQWSAASTNLYSGEVTTNTLYLSDAFGVDTNFMLAPAGTSLSSLPFYIPTNYTITHGFNDFNGLRPPNTPYNAAFYIGAFPATNEYTALGVTVSAVTSTPDPSSSVSSVSNVPGRIEINATNNLDLTRAIVTGANYLNLIATNNFAGSAGAQIVYPFGDINLATTNGIIAVSNLVAPEVPLFDGTIDVYSARWTNVVNGTTNAYHILMVDANLAPTSPVQINNLTLRTTNVASPASTSQIFISDMVNVASNLLLNAQAVTITSNDCDALTPTGALNFLPGNILWSTSFPILEYLTNWGSIGSSNSVYLEGIRQNPYYTSNFTQSYLAVVNHGQFTATGISTWANYFENTGSGIGLTTNCNGVVSNGTNIATINSIFGPFSLQASNAVLRNGVIQTIFTGDITLSSGSLTISNHPLGSSGALNISVTNSISDTGSNANNFWLVSDGINLPVLPASGDLLGTTISNIGPGGADIQNVWAGQDRGASVAGFLNNAAIGHLILDGGSSTTAFTFSPVSATNAIYVDLLDLQNGAAAQGTKRINNANQTYYPAVDASPGMTIYYADAIASNIDISIKLNGNPTDSGGQVIWVPSYAGFFSSTNVTYPSGNTYTLNRGLVISGYPIFVNEDIKLGIVDPPGASVVISWETVAGATNHIYTSTNLLGTNWTLVTSFPSSLSGMVKYTNSAPDPGPRYYKVRVDPPQP